MLTDEYKNTVIECNKDEQLLLDLCEITDLKELGVIIKEITRRGYKLYRKRGQEKAIQIIGILDKNKKPIIDGAIPEEAYLAYIPVGTYNIRIANLRECAKAIMMIPFDNDYYD